MDMTADHSAASLGVMLALQADCVKPVGVAVNERDRAQAMNAARIMIGQNLLRASLAGFAVDSVFDILAVVADQRAGT